VVSDGAEHSGSARLRANRLLLGTVAAAALLADQLTKLWALRVLSDGDIHLFWTIRLRLVFNKGAAFGLGTSLGPFITVAAVVVSVALIVTVWSSVRRSVSALAGLVLGGALGNLGDRAFRGDRFFDGSVVDFVDPQWWPVFNVADAAISVGVVIFLVLGVRSGIRGQPLLGDA
jgi:signal peptidase II